MTFRVRWSGRSGVHPAGRGAPTIGARSSRALRRLLRCASKRDAERRRGVGQGQRELRALGQFDGAGRRRDARRRSDRERRRDAQRMADECDRRRCTAAARAGALMRRVRRPGPVMACMRRSGVSPVVRNGHRHVCVRMRLFCTRRQRSAVHRARAPLHRARDPDGKGGRAQQTREGSPKTATHDC